MKRRDEVLVGIVATVAVVLGVIGSLLLARGGLASGYPVYSVFSWGSGLRPGQPVLFSGVTVGYVSDVSFRRDGYLVVEMRINKEYEIPRTTIARIVPNGVFGDMMVAMTVSGMTEDDFAVGDTIPAGPPSIGIGDVLARVDSIGRDVQALTAGLNRELVQEGGLAELRATVRNANVFLNELTRIAKAQSDELSRTQAAVRRVVSAVDSAAVDSTVKALSGAATAMGALATDLQTTTQQLNGVLAKLEGGEGSAGLLLNDPGLYRDTRALLTRLDSLTADFQRNPRKYVKLSIF
ncbi:MAG TPA: MlaD family protein [Gemmatimonadaceae bacterium]|nr:MlaD family protein [Gemmatimonadaceae bacterium]HRQ78197.1 MlaD family protein [Gemmatimonadaceae bacterium]